jgi:crotonobetainyl-CoA:carnitine CoA-transferase CaiB-like acyl-CoA transferase
MNSFFKNLTILDLSSVLAGPSVSQFFAELGADVIKVENIHTHGDVTRSWKLKAEDQNSDSSSYFISSNWGKKSIAIDLSVAEGIKVIYSLAKKADIFLHNFKKGDDTKFALDYQKMMSINPSLIYAGIIGFSEESERTGYDAIIQAESGFISMNGMDRNSVHKMPVAMIDILAAHQLKEAILVALINRGKEKIAKITVSLFDSAISALANQASNFLNTGLIPEAIGSDHPNIVPYGSHFKCNDGVELIFAIGTNQQFRKLLKILDLDELIDDEKYNSNQNRVKNKVGLKKNLSEKIKTIQSDNLYEFCLKEKIPVGRINNLKDVFEKNNVSSVILSEDRTQSVRQFIASNRESMVISKPPKLSEHSNYILEHYLSYDHDTISNLRKRNIII